MKNLALILTTTLFFFTSLVEAALPKGYEQETPGTASSRRLRVVETEEVKIDVNTTASASEEIEEEEYESEEEIEEEELAEAPLPVEEEEDVVVIDLKDVGVRFKTNRFTLEGKSLERLEKIGQLLAKNNQLWKQLRLEGHTDSRGSDAYNMNLSELRVKTVMEIILAQRVAGKKVSLFAYGENSPIDTANTPEAWEKNRRVELKLYGIESDSALAKSLAQMFEDDPTKIPSNLIARNSRTTIIKQASTAPVIIKDARKRTFTINLYQAGVHFGFNKDQLRRRSADKVKQVAQLLQKHKGQWREVVLSGHTDKKGSDRYNMGLSKRRTRTVGRLLLSEGLEKNRLSGKAYGERNPIIKGNNEYANARNRRVEIKLTQVRSDSPLARELEALFK